MLTLRLQNHSHDQTIDTQDTRHDNGYDGFEDKVGLEDSHRGNTDSTLSGSISSSEVCTTGVNGE